MNRIKTVRSGSINDENSQTMNSRSYPPKDLVLASVSLMFYFECLLFLLAFSGERPFVCNRPNCCKSFVSKSKLVEHLQRHNGEKRHMCCLCGKKYANKHDLRAHTRYVSSSSLFSSESLAGFYFSRSTRLLQSELWYRRTSIATSLCTCCLSQVKFSQLFTKYAQSYHK